MPTDLSIQCSCGSFRGVARGISPGVGIHGICYCDDCQAFADYLGARDTTLDSHGGTEIFQMSPAALTIGQGLENLACLRLTPRGPLRWYTDCCKSPIGNTPPTRQLPFLGLVCSRIVADGQVLERILGPVTARVMVRYATGDVKSLENTHDGFPISHVVRMAWKLLVWRIRGDHKRSPLFAAAGAPVCSPIPVGERARAGGQDASRR